MIKTIRTAFLLLFAVSISHASQIIEEGYIIHDKTLLKEISMQKDLVIDHVTSSGFEVFGPKGLGLWLKNNNFSSTSIKKINSLVKDNYPTPEEVANDLKGVTSKYPELSKMFSIGKSTKGRDLWVIKISKNVNENDSRPEFKYIANMHGDEIVGRELMTRLIHDLLENYGKDPYITKLVDTTQIYILPSMNPDGAAMGTRGNANYVDLNRDFPDFSTQDNADIPDKRAPETQAVMNWQYTRHFILSANFHGGAEVVNYPWDTIPDQHPQFNLVKDLSLSYAKLAPYIFNSTAFENGITNGYAWYEVNGGMQDWSWYWHKDLQLTVELSNNKWPEFKNVSYYYSQNRTALLDFIYKVHTVH